MGHYYNDIQGWFDYEDVWRQAISETPDGGIIAEIGCWKGQSLSFLLVEARRTGRRFNIVGVDHFLGSSGEAYQIEEAAHEDIERLCRSNLDRADYPYRLLRLSSCKAASAFQDGSISFCYIDAAHGYHDVRTDVSAWLPKVRWGGWLGGHDYKGAWPGVSLAVHDFIPRGELQSRGVSWLWRKDMPERGRWVKEPDKTLDWIIYLPYVNREDLLGNALRSLGAHSERVVVIDQSDAGMSEGKHHGPLFRWHGPRRFTSVMNWIQRDTLRRGLGRFLFMHSDAEAAPGGIDALLRMADDLDAQGTRWGVIFTRYDALAVFNQQAVTDVGCWDDSFLWYIADVDYYNRIQWRGWCHAELPSALAIHRGSQTLAGLPPQEAAAVHHDHGWSHDHYRHKWGCHWEERPERRVWEIPYNGHP